MTAASSSYYNQHGQPISPEAFYALQAAARYKSIGRDAAIRYMMKRTGLPFQPALRLITLARVLSAAA